MGNAWSGNQEVCPDLRLVESAILEDPTRLIGIVMLDRAWAYFRTHRPEAVRHYPDVDQVRRRHPGLTSSSIAEYATEYDEILAPAFLNLIAGGNGQLVFTSDQPGADIFAIIKIGDKFTVQFQEPGREQAAKATRMFAEYSRDTGYTGPKWLAQLFECTRPTASGPKPSWPNLF